MALAQSKVTAQGQISVPLSVRKKLGVGPGSVLEWDVEGDQVVVRRRGKFTSKDIHDAVFGGKTPKRRSIKEFKKGIEQYIRERHAGGRY
jgi:AbrB family looped-hinge helix DNA binding protein